jgi:hypothetical protein
MMLSSRSPGDQLEKRLGRFGRFQRRKYPHRDSAGPYFGQVALGNRHCRRLGRPPVPGRRSSGSGRRPMRQHRELRLSGELPVRDRQSIGEPLYDEGLPATLYQQALSAGSIDGDQQDSRDEVARSAPARRRSAPDTDDRPPAAGLARGTRKPPAPQGGTARPRSEPPKPAGRAQRLAARRPGSSKPASRPRSLATARKDPAAVR